MENTSKPNPYRWKLLLIKYFHCQDYPCPNLSITLPVLVTCSPNICLYSIFLSLLWISSLLIRLTLVLSTIFFVVVGNASDKKLHAVIHHWPSSNRNVNRVYSCADSDVINLIACLCETDSIVSMSSAVETTALIVAIIYSEEHFYVSN